jgi:hypothetical protein
MSGYAIANPTYTLPLSQVIIPADDALCLNLMAMMLWRVGTGKKAVRPLRRRLRQKAAMKKLCSLVGWVSEA